MASMKPVSDSLCLTQDQDLWLQHWLSKFGAWVYSGRLEKRQSSIIAQLMLTVERRDEPWREMCSDDDGLFIAKVVDNIYQLDRIAFSLLLCRYVFNRSDRAIARYYHSLVKPRVMIRRNRTQEYRKPSMSTCRREVNEILSAAEYLIYPILKNAFKKRENESKTRKNDKNLLTSLIQ
ncbi:MAG TPA: antiterminator Q family protein [Arsenophonus apicola]|uniref:antiterminator Q family protein n=1 Tax=Arsenophonus TaxID=637 RepID=UPI0015D86DD4|nr:MULTISPECIES: antiterminator Q family protein [Arsenophonus]UBX30288.1 DUF1133 family protein [Arsenophonus apicola]